MNMPRSKHLRFLLWFSRVVLKHQEDDGEKHTTSRRGHNLLWPSVRRITPALRSKSGNCSAATAELSATCTAVCVGVSVSPVWRAVCAASRIAAFWGIMGRQWPREASFTPTLSWRRLASEPCTNPAGCSSTGRWVTEIRRHSMSGAQLLNI